MKRMIAALLLLSSFAQAYEVADNPDRFISAGLEYQGASLSGDNDYPQVPSVKRSDMKETIDQFMGDIRFPVNSLLTLHAGVGLISHTIKSYDSDTLLFQTDDTLTGVTYKIGARLYFH